MIKTTPTKINTGEKIDRLTNIEKLLEAFCKMDIDTIEELLDENLEHEVGGNKYNLINQVNEHFKKIKKQRCTRLIAVPGNCKGCRNGTLGYRFEDNKTKERITYIIIETENGKFNLSDCSAFHVCGEPVPETCFPF